MAWNRKYTKQQHWIVGLLERTVLTHALEAHVTPSGHGDDGRPAFSATRRKTRPRLTPGRRVGPYGRRDRYSPRCRCRRRPLSCRGCPWSYEPREHWTLVCGQIGVDFISPSRPKRAAVTVWAPPTTDEDDDDDDRDAFERVITRSAAAAAAAADTPSSARLGGGRMGAGAERDKDAARRRERVITVRRRRPDNDNNDWRYCLPRRWWTTSVKYRIIYSIENTRGFRIFHSTQREWRNRFDPLRTIRFAFEMKKKMLKSNLVI